MYKALFKTYTKLHTTLHNCTQLLNNPKDKEQNITNNNIQYSTQTLQHYIVLRQTSQNSTKQMQDYSKLYKSITKVLQNDTTLHKKDLQLYNNFTKLYTAIQT